MLTSTTEATRPGSSVAFDFNILAVLIPFHLYLVDPFALGGLPDKWVSSLTPIRWRFDMLASININKK